MDFIDRHLVDCGFGLADTAKQLDRPRLAAVGERRVADAVRDLSERMMAAGRVTAVDVGAIRRVRVTVSVFMSVLVLVTMTIGMRMRVPMRAFLSRRPIGGRPVLVRMAGRAGFVAMDW